jgi:phage FluMu gp28-like protein
LEGASSIFQSINLDEAREKIIYARTIFEYLNIGGLPKITQPDTTTQLGFDNGARIISSPGTPQRGKARFWMYFDEWAWQKHDRANYTAAFPIISKGGKVRGASSPAGSSGIFWEIYKQELRPYPGYTRKATPWWEVQAFCSDVREARTVAPTLAPRQRIERYGNERIYLIYENMPNEDFSQEYECEFIDESTAWIAWEEIKTSQDAGLLCFVASGVDRCRQAIDDLAAAVASGKAEAAFTAGYDVGRTRNTSELFIIGKSTTDTYPLRAALTLDNVEYDDQFDIICYACERLPMITLLIDRNGIGNNLAENAEKRFPGKCQGAQFTNTSKALWAGDAKMLVQQHKTPLPLDRDIAYQIHSIKRLITPSKNVVFDTERNEKHHADKFWAWALGLSVAKIEPAKLKQQENPFY